MGVNVLTGNIRNEIPVPVTLSIQNKAAFLLLVAWAEALAAKKEPEFKRHIESRKPGGRIQFDCREIVDPELAFLDHPFDLRQAELRRVVVFQRTAGYKAEVTDCEDNRVEDRPITRVERAIDEDMVASDSFTHHLLSGG